MGFSFRRSSSSASSLVMAVLSGVLGSFLWQELLSWASLAKDYEHDHEPPLRFWHYMLRALPARLSAGHRPEEPCLHEQSTAVDGNVRNRIPLRPAHYVLRPQADPRL